MCTLCTPTPITRTNKNTYLHYINIRWCSVNHYYVVDVWFNSNYYTQPRGTVPNLQLTRSYPPLRFTGYYRNVLPPRLINHLYKRWGNKLTVIGYNHWGATYNVKGIVGNGSGGPEWGHNPYYI